MQHRSFPRSRQDGGSGTELEADHPQVHLPVAWISTVFYDLDMSYLRAADAAIRRAAAVAAEPRPLAEARLVAEAAAQGQEGCAAPGEARGGEDAPAQTDLPATDAGQHDERLQPQDLQFTSVQFSSVAQSCPTLCDPVNRSTPDLPVHHQLPEFTQTHIHRVGDAIQPSHPLSSPSPLAPNPSQHQSLFQGVNSSHEVAKVLEF